jgi:hypothetical protein
VNNEVMVAVQMKMVEAFASAISRIEQIRNEPVERAKQEFSQQVMQLAGEVNDLKAMVRQLGMAVGDLQHIRGEVQRMAAGIEAVAAMNKKRRVQKLELKKDEQGKPLAVSAGYDDGSTDEIAVG